jgi:protein-tyrosine phosphatase
MPRESPVRVCFVCSGNICRSPIAEVVLRELARRAGAQALVLADSAGTGDWHVGGRADPRALRALAAAGYDGSAHRVRQFDPRWFAERDLIVALDRGHERTLRSWAGAAERDKIRLLRGFDPGLRAGTAPAECDVADPYYGADAGFTAVLRQVESACEGLLAHLLEQAAPRWRCG